MAGFKPKPDTRDIRSFGAILLRKAASVWDSWHPHLPHELIITLNRFLLSISALTFSWPMSILWLLLILVLVHRQSLWYAVVLCFRRIAISRCLQEPLLRLLEVSFWDFACWLRQRQRMNFWATARLLMPRKRGAAVENMDSEILECPKLHRWSHQKHTKSFKMIRWHVSQGILSYCKIL